MLEARINLQKPPVLWHQVSRPWHQVPPGIDSHDVGGHALHLCLDPGETLPGSAAAALKTKLIRADLPQVRLHLPHLFAEETEISHGGNLT
jgi:hypothetical protein